MKGALASLAAAFVVACSGCGGGGDEPTPRDISNAPAQRSIVIDAQGDSTIWGFQTADNFKKHWQTPNNPPALLEKALQERFGNSITVQNHGHPGAMIGDRMNGVNGYTQTYTQEIATNKADIVIVNFALNDAHKSALEPVEQYKAFLIDFVQQSQAAGRIVVLEEPNPIDFPINVSTIPRYVDAMNEVAKEMGIAIVHQYDHISAMPNWKSLLIDGIHPTDELYRIKAQRQAEVIGPIVGKLLAK